MLRRSVFVLGGYTKYSLGEIREEIVKKGYPVDLVNECLIQELSNQYISLR